VSVDDVGRRGQQQKREPSAGKRSLRSLEQNQRPYICTAKQGRAAAFRRKSSPCVYCASFFFFLQKEEEEKKKKTKKADEKLRSRRRRRRSLSNNYTRELSKKFLPLRIFEHIANSQIAVVVSEPPPIRR
jgi:hypothetical protein